MRTVTRPSTVDHLASCVSAKLGRRVTVHRVPKSGIKPSPSAVDYTIAIEGCHPSAFYGLTVGEAKGRLAMISDMLTSRVIKPGEA